MKMITMTGRPPGYRVRADVVYATRVERTNVQRDLPYALELGVATAPELITEGWYASREAAQARGNEICDIIEAL